MAFGFNDNKSKAPIINDVVKVQALTITTNTIPPHTGASAGGAVDVSNTLPGYTPIGIVGWQPYNADKSDLRTCFIINIGSGHEYLSYTFTNTTESSVTNKFTVYILYIKK